MKRFLGTLLILCCVWQPAFSAENTLGKEAANIFQSKGVLKPEYRTCNNNADCTAVLCAEKEYCSDVPGVCSIFMEVNKTSKEKIDNTLKKIASDSGQKCDQPKTKIIIDGKTLDIKSVMEQRVYCIKGFCKAPSPDFP